MSENTPQTDPAPLVVPFVAGASAITPAGKVWICPACGSRYDEPTVCTNQHPAEAALEYDLAPEDVTPAAPAEEPPAEDPAAETVPALDTAPPAPPAPPEPPAPEPSPRQQLEDALKLAQTMLADALELLTKIG